MHFALNALLDLRTMTEKRSSRRTKYRKQHIFVKLIVKCGRINNKLKENVPKLHASILVNQYVTQILFLWPTRVHDNVALSYKIRLNARNIYNNTPKEFTAAIRPEKSISPQLNYSLKLEKQKQKINKRKTSTCACQSAFSFNCADTSGIAFITHTLLACMAVAAANR